MRSSAAGGRDRDIAACALAFALKVEEMERRIDMLVTRLDDVQDAEQAT